LFGEENGFILNNLVFVLSVQHKLYIRCVPSWSR